MNALRATLVCLLCMMSVESSSVIQDIGQPCALHQVIAEADPSTTLLVLDVDFTLMQPVHPALQFGSIRRYPADFQEVLGHLTHEQRDLFATVAVSAGEGSIAADSGTAEAVRQFQERGGRVIALTAMLTGDFGGYLGNVCQIRCERMAEQGFDFSKSFSQLPDCFEFDEWSAYRGHHPEFRRGILTSNGEGSHPTKGEMLKSFFRRLGWAPVRILFVDDKREHLQDVAMHLDQLDPSIHMTGIHYKAVRAQPPTKELSRDEVVAEWNRLAELVITLSQST